MVSNNILVSVLMITYNHEKYIAEAIESVIMQKTNFDYEIVIGEDCSTDRTREIVLEYKAKHPDKIKLLLQEKNVGMMQNFIDTFKTCNGKYIALLEGDDYWTDPLKLQKQVDFLEANPEYSMCFHNALVKYENKRKKPHLFFKYTTVNRFSIKDIIERSWFIPTQSIIFRKKTLEFPLWTSYVFGGDFALQLILATKGNFWGMNDVMSVYRKNNSSVSSKKPAGFHLIKKIETLAYFNIHTDFKYHQVISNKINSLILNSEAILILSSSKYHKIINPLYYYYKLKSILAKQCKDS